MLAAVLWLGNISFIVIDNENHVEAVEDEGLFNVSKLIGCGMDELKLALSTRKMRVGNDNIVQKLTLTQAIDTRDALAKSIYACLFEWLDQDSIDSRGVARPRFHRGLWLLQFNWRNPTIHEWFKFNSFVRMILQLFSSQGNF